MSYLPDGCTQADCDRAAGAFDEPEPDMGNVCIGCGAKDDETCEAECPTRRGRA